jgi:hypothetical protein
MRVHHLAAWASDPQLGSNEARTTEAGTPTPINSSQQVLTTSNDRQQEPKEANGSAGMKVLKEPHTHFDQVSVLGVHHRDRANLLATFHARSKLLVRYLRLLRPIDASHTRTPRDATLRKLDAV